MRNERRSTTKCVCVCVCVELWRGQNRSERKANERFRLLRRASSSDRQASVRNERFRPIAVPTAMPVFETRGVRPLSVRGPDHYARRMSGSDRSSRETAEFFSRGFS